MVYSKFVILIMSLILSLSTFAGAIDPVKSKKSTKLVIEVSSKISLDEALRQIKTQHLNYVHDLGYNDGDFWSTFYIWGTNICGLIAESGGGLDVEFYFGTTFYDSNGTRQCRLALDINLYNDFN